MCLRPLLAGFSIFCSIRCVATDASESTVNLVDPCHFPTPHYPNFAGLCQYHYHQLKFVCDPLAFLSRTESDLLGKRFENYSLSGCIDCQNTIERECVPSSLSNSFRLSVLIVPYTNTQRIESCVAGRFRNSHYTASEAVRAYAETVQRNWGESGCSVDLTILYVGTLYNPSTNVKQPNPFVARLFANSLGHISQMSSIKIISGGQSLFDTLQSELDRSISIAQIDDHFTRTSQFSNQRPNQPNGIPTWAFVVCAILLLLVVITVYLGNCLTKKFNTRSHHNRPSNGLLSSQNSKIGLNSSNDRWRAGFGGGLMSASGISGSAQNTSMTGNLNVPNTKSSMGSVLIIARNSKKQHDRSKAAVVQKI